jgi:[ribosomal protein S5]-alanine N-acetyltransferase
MVGSIRSSMVILETERLQLRYMNLEDIPFLVNLWTDPDVTRFMGGPREIANLREYLVKTAENPLAQPFDLWPLEEKCGGELVGHCGVIDKEVDNLTEYELVYVLAKNAWGKGYASEIGRALLAYAYHYRHINRLVALVDPGNIASEKVAVKLGMHFEKEIIRPGGSLRRVYAVFLPH